MKKQKIIAASLLTLFCLLFFRTDNAQKSMVRALLLEPGPQGWTVGLLYQAPEAATDSSEAAAEIRFAAVEASSLEQGLVNVQSVLPQTANYRLCDYLLLLPGSSWQTLAEAEQLILDRSCGRTAAFVEACDFTCSELSEWTEEDGELSKLLDQIKAAQEMSPRLYEKNLTNGLLLPLLRLEETGPQIAQEGWFVGPAGSSLWDARQTTLYHLLSGRKNGGRLWKDGAALEIRRCIRSVEPDEAGGFVLRLDCQTLDETGPSPGSEEAEWLEQLCIESLQQWWAQGLDPLGLGGFSALRNGVEEMLQPQKNACPQLQADVRFMSFF